MAKFVREELANEEHEAEAERMLPRWRVLERCAVREAVSIDSATRVELSPDDVVIELGQEIVGEGLHIRCDRGWLSAEHLEKVEELKHQPLFDQLDWGRVYKRRCRSCMSYKPRIP